MKLVKILTSKTQIPEYMIFPLRNMNKTLLELGYKVKIKYSSQIKYNQPIKRINGKKISRKILIKEDLKKYFNSYQDLI